MTMMSEMVVFCIKKPSNERTTEEINNLLPWLRKKSDKFDILSSEVLYEIIKNCTFNAKQRDDIIIRQGDKGDCFFVILSGKVSIFINTEAVPDNPEEASIIVTEDKFNDQGKAKKELDRDRYGKFIAVLESGKAFGELALINEDCIRNASIIADEATDLLVVNRDLYNRSMKEVHRQEFNQRMNFVNKSELFFGWLSKYKRQVAFSIRKEKFGFNMPLAIQGEPTNGLTFILKGQAKVVVNVHQHSFQYPRMNLLNNSEEVKINEINDLERSLDDFELKRSIQNISVKRLPYSEAEQRQAQRSIEISIVTSGEIVGDLEQGLELSTYAQSIITIEPTEVYILDAKNFERLINSKRNVKTLTLLRQKAVKKLKHRGKYLESRPVPFYSKLNSIVQEVEERQNKEEQNKIQSSKVIDKGETTFREHRGPLINIYGPGSVFYRNRQMRKEKVLSEKKKKIAQMSLKGHTGHRRNDHGMSLEFGTKHEDILEDYSSSEEQDNFEKVFAGSNMNQYKLLEAHDKPHDWETGSVHLQCLETRLQNWFLSVNNLTLDKRHGNNKSVEQYTVLKRFKPDENEKRIIPGKKIFLRPKVPVNKPKKLIEDDSREKVFITARRFKSSSFSNKSTEEFQENIPEIKESFSQSLPVFQKDSFNITENKGHTQRKFKPEEHPLLAVHQYTTEEYKGLKQLLKKREIEMRVFQTAMSI